jgi:hypothetical protein
MLRMLQMMKRKDYVESLRGELKKIRKKLHDSTQGDSICSIDGKNQASSLPKRYEGMEYVVREAVKNLEMGRATCEIEAALLLNEARFKKIIQSKVVDKSDWKSYARGGLEGVVIVRALMT